MKMQKRYAVVRRLIPMLAGALFLADALPVHGAVAPGQLLITELMANPATPNDTSGEWIEIRNAGGDIFDLGTLRLQDAANNFFEMPSGTPLAAGEHFLFTRGVDPVVNGISFSDFVYSGALTLNNTTESLSLFSNGVLIDSVSYASTSSGISLSFTTQSDSYGSSLVYEAVYNQRGTPGAMNELLREGVVGAIPEPQTYALLLAGLGLLGFVGRRRQGKFGL